MRKLLTILTVAFAVLACADKPKEKPAATEDQTVVVTHQDLKLGEVEVLLDSIDSIQIVDVRTPKEWEEGVLENAILIDYFDDDFSKNLAKLNKDLPVLVYCRSGGRSTKAAKELIDLGYDPVFNMIEGASLWYQTGRPTVEANQD